MDAQVERESQFLQLSLLMIVRGVPFELVDHNASERFLRRFNSSRSCVSPVMFFGDKSYWKYESAVAMTDEADF